jgi:DNA-binding PadR family transcriptional regulator
VPAEGAGAAGDQQGAPFGGPEQVEGLASGERVERQRGGVSQKMLTQTLRSLERDGVLTRTVTPSVPVRVDYGLTAG